MTNNFKEILIQGTEAVDALSNDPEKQLALVKLICKRLENEIARVSPPSTEPAISQEELQSMLVLGRL
jgi:hypothetical protein